MTTPTTDELLIYLILYGLLPLWGITGFIDWIRSYSHAASLPVRGSRTKNGSPISIPRATRAAPRS